MSESDDGPKLIDVETLKDFFFGKREKGSTVQEMNREDGRCPLCSEIAYIHLSTFICPTHGPY